MKRLERKYKEASTNNTKIESVDFFMKLRVPESNLKNKKYTIYKEEFDPGSG